MDCNSQIRFLPLYCTNSILCTSSFEFWHVYYLVPSTSYPPQHASSDNRYLEAVRNYEAVLRKPPHWGHDGELLLLAANAHFCDGRHADCLKALSRALRGNPGDASLWHNVAVSVYMQTDCN
jgi:tetratricopeptide (TPR) repeat protein